MKESKASTPAVSVLISAYNHESYIEACISSVLEQTYPNVELIVIDDGSPDNTATIIAALKECYAAQGKHFTFIAKTNSGLTDTLNQALALATGKYVCQFGSDDIMMPDRFEKQVAFMEAHPEYGICAGNSIVIDKEGAPNKKQHHDPARVLGFDDIFTRSKPGIRTATALIRTDLLRKIGGYNPKIKLEDIYMWLKITSTGISAYVLDDVLAYYRKHDSNASNDVLFMANNILQIYGEYSTHPAYEKTVNHFLINFFSKACKRGYKNPMAVFKMISPRYYNAKVFLGLLRLLFRKIKS